MVDVYYHKKCYSGLMYTYQLISISFKTKKLRISLLIALSKRIKLRVLKDKEAFLLTEILLDLKEMSYDFGLDSPPSRLTHTYQLKKMILSCLRDKINIVIFKKQRSRLHLLQLCNNQRKWIVRK